MKPIQNTDDWDRPLTDEENEEREEGMSKEDWLEEDEFLWDE